jgi:GAF domain-containing protein
VVVHLGSQALMKSATPKASDNARDVSPKMIIALGKRNPDSLGIVAAPVSAAIVVAVATVHSVTRRAGFESWPSQTKNPVDRPVVDFKVQIPKRFHRPEVMSPESSARALTAGIADKAADKPLASVLCAPMGSSNQCAGSLSAHGHTPGSFRDREIAFHGVGGEHGRDLGAPTVGAMVVAQVQ